MADPTLPVELQQTITLIPATATSSERLIVSSTVGDVEVRKTYVLMGTVRLEVRNDG